MSCGYKLPIAVDPLVQRRSGYLAGRAYYYQSLWDISTMKGKVGRNKT